MTQEQFTRTVAAISENNTWTPFNITSLFEGGLDTDANITALCQALLTNTNLTTLTFEGASLSDQAIARILTSLAGNSSLTTLHLQHSGMGPLSAKALGTLVINNKHITEVDVSDNPLGDSLVPFLAAFFPPNEPALKTLNARNTMGKGKICHSSAVAQGLMQGIRKSLTVLDITGNGFTPGVYTFLDKLFSDGFTCMVTIDDNPHPAVASTTTTTSTSSTSSGAASTATVAAPFAQTVGGIYYTLGVPLETNSVGAEQSQKLTRDSFNQAQNLTLYRNEQDAKLAQVQKTTRSMDAKGKFHIATPPCLCIQLKPDANIREGNIVAPQDVLIADYWCDAASARVLVKSEEHLERMRQVILEAINAYSKEDNTEVRGLDEAQQFACYSPTFHVAGAEASRHAAGTYHGPMGKQNAEEIQATITGARDTSDILLALKAYYNPEFWRFGTGRWDKDRSLKPLIHKALVFAYGDETNHKSFNSKATVTKEDATKFLQTIVDRIHAQTFEHRGEHTATSSASTSADDERRAGMGNGGK